MKKIFTASVVLTAWLSSFAAQGQERAVVTDNRVNVRGQAKLGSEVITQLKKGDQVTVIERIPAPNAKAGEPANWARIKLPPNTAVWVFAPMLKDGVVSATRLNLRAGPGENYSVLGRVNKGAPLKEIRTVEDWTEIEPPAEAYAFVDARLLKTAEGSTEMAATEGAAPATAAATTTPPEAAQAETPKDDVAIPATTAAAAAAIAALEPNEATPTPQPEEAKLETAAVNNEGANVAKAQDVAEPAKAEDVSDPDQEAAALEKARALARTAIAGAAIGSSATSPRQSTPPRPTVPDLTLHLPKTAPEPEVREPEKERRIVRREGFVKGTFSIQAPTYFELENAATGKAVNYLHAEKSGFKLKEYKNQRVVITGEEFIDPRWPKTPVIEIETLEPAQ